MGLSARTFCQPDGHPRVPQRPRVVLVDDEPAILETLSLILSAAGYEVQTFLNPLPALKAIEAGCDCVITDYHMPEMSGAELIRASRPRSKARFMVLTGNGSETVMREAMEAGASCVLHKPSHAPVLLQKLAAICG